MSAPLSRVRISQADYERLHNLLDHTTVPDEDALELLESKLNRAEVMREGALPPEVVAMKSVVRFEDLESGTARQLMLVYPQEARGASECVSILAPVGVALLGHSGGDVIETAMKGRTRRFRIVEVVQERHEAGEHLPPAA